jgi:hypothetical protein
MKIRGLLLAGALAALPLSAGACAVPCDDATGDTSQAVLADDDCGEDDD